MKKMEEGPKQRGGGGGFLKGTHHLGKNKANLKILRMEKELKVLAEGVREVRRRDKMKKGVTHLAKEAMVIRKNNLSAAAHLGGQDKGKDKLQIVWKVEFSGGTSCFQEGQPKGREAFKLKGCRCKGKGKSNFIIRPRGDRNL